jgi:hypothetical protein
MCNLALKILNCNIKYVIHNLKISRRLNWVKYSRATNRVKQLDSEYADVSRAISALVISERTTMTRAEMALEKLAYSPLSYLI